MMLIAHDTETDACASAQILRSMGMRTKKLLEECVEHQSIKRRAMSLALKQLDDAGFVFIRDSGDMWQPELTITPSLAGEEALEALELIEAGDALNH